MAKGAFEGAGKGLGKGLVGVMFEKFKDYSDETLALLSGASANSLEQITGTVNAVAGISADNDDDKTSFGEAIATRLIGGGMRLLASDD